MKYGFSFFSFVLLTLSSSFSLSSVHYIQTLFILLLIVLFFFNFDLIFCGYFCNIINMFVRLTNKRMQLNV